MAQTTLKEKQRQDIVNNQKLLRSVYDEGQRYSLRNVSISENAESAYLHFNAYSIRDMLVRKLSADPAFASEIYPGSNLSLLIDLVAYTYQVLVYQINHAAAESMFSDTQYYENIIRLVKFLGYNAKGIVPSSAMFELPNADQYPHWRILPFSTVTINEKHYSYCPIGGCKSLEIPANMTSGSTYSMVLLNGKWKRYDQTLTATGSDYETFRLNIGSDLENKKYATTNNIYVVEVVKAYKSTNREDVDWQNTIINWFSPTSSGLFKAVPKMMSSAYETSSLIYSGASTSDNRVFNVELDADKNIVLTFGNGLETDKLHPGAELYIFYLETDGKEGTITPGEKTAPFEHNSSMFSINNSLYCSIFGIGSYDIDTDAFTVTQTNTTSAVTENKMLDNASATINDLMHIRCVSSSSPCYAEEGVEEIRENAPGWYKLNNRLVTKEDYEFYLRTEPDFKANIADVKVMNNWEYASTFYRWLNQLGIKYHNSATYYLNSARFAKYGNASLADPADNNNVYIWYISTLNSTTLNFNQLVLRYKSRLSIVRDLTQEPVFMPAVPVTCEISSVPQEIAKRLLTTSRGRSTVGVLASGEENTWLEVRMSNNYTYTSTKDVATRVATVISQFFNINNHKITFGYFSTNTILNEVFNAVPGVAEVYTAYKPGVNTDVVYTPGICLNCWVRDTTLVNLGDAFWSGTQLVLEEFQYPVFWTQSISDISEKIKVISNNLTNSVIF